MTLKLYDLAARDANIRFSPFCWRAKLALKHKGLAFEAVPWRFTDKDAIAATGQGRVPVLQDDDRWVHESWRIALYLDEAYCERPALLQTQAEHVMARLVTHWCDLTLHPALRPLLLLSVYRIAAEKNQAYFRESREKMLGAKLEELCSDRPGALKALSKTLTPIENTLAESAFLGGEGPNYADYIFFGSPQWARVVSPEPVLAHDSAVARWFERMLDLFDGYGRIAATVRHA